MMHMQLIFSTQIQDATIEKKLQVNCSKGLTDGNHLSKQAVHPLILIIIN